MIEIKAEELDNYKIVGEFIIPGKIKEDKDSVQKSYSLRFLVDTMLEPILYDGFRTRKIAFANKQRTDGWENIKDGQVITLEYKVAGKREALNTVEKCTNAALTMSDKERDELIAKLQAMQPKK